MSDTPIRVGVVLDWLGLGGVELGCLDLVARLDPRRYAAFVYAFRPGELCERVRAAGLPLEIGHDRPAGDPGWDDRDREARRAWADRLAALFARDRIDVCLVHGWPEAIPAARAAGVRAIVESVDGGITATRVQDKGGLSRIVCESRHVRHLLLAQRTRLALDPARIVVIPNGVDLERFDPRRVSRADARAALGLPADAFVVGSLARLVPVKNQRQIVEGFAGYLRLGGRIARHARLVLAGPDGGERAALERCAAELGIAGQVLFPGLVADAAQALAALDVFALTSWFEGRPYALLEAMAMGLPIVATPVGAVPELLDDNAIIVEPMATHPTAQAFSALAGDPALRERLGARSRALARRASAKRMARRYMQLFDKVLAEAPRR